MIRYYRRKWIFMWIALFIFILYIFLHQYYLLHTYAETCKLFNNQRTTEEYEYTANNAPKPEYFINRSDGIQEAYETPQTLSSTHTTKKIKKKFNMNHLRADDRSSLIDLHNFDFILNSNPCESAPLLLILIHSAVHHVDLRLSIRITWGQPNDLIRVVFLVAMPRAADLQKKLKLESALFRDMVQGNFIDDYRNMTYKHAMGLKWFVYHCPRAGYVLKLDDDTFLNTPYALSYVRKLIDSSEERLVCDIYRNSPVVRDENLKWYVSYKEYPDRSNRYPTYCSGYAILYAPKTAFKLYKELQEAAYFWIDDVYITGVIAARAKVSHRQFVLHSDDWWDQVFDDCALPNEPFLLGPLNMPVDIIEKLWNMVESANASRWN